MNKDFIAVWTEIGIDIANGGVLSLSDLQSIGYNIQVEKMHFGADKSNLISGSPKDRKDRIFDAARWVWGFTPDYWLRKETEWLDESRKISGSNIVGGKDKLDDVVSAEVLVRLVSAAILVQLYNDVEIRKEVLNAVNCILNEVCSKGRTRMQMRENQSVYSIMKNKGLMIGTGGGKFLPYPQKSLPELLLLLHKDKIAREVYI